MKIVKYSFLIPFLVILLIDSYGNHSKQKNKLPDRSTNTSKESPCSVKRIKLYGRVQVVDSFADLTIKYVNSFGDIRVQLVESFPDECGEWKMVESFPDFTVEVVESFADLDVEIVDSFPGMN